MTLRTAVASSTDFYYADASSAVAGAQREVSISLADLNQLDELFAEILAF